MQLGVEPILGSPFEVSITPNTAKGSLCELSGDGLSGGTAGEDNSFTITAKDAYGNRLVSGGDGFVAQLSGSAWLTTTVNDHGDGTYTVVYKPMVSGPYSITVALAGEQLLGSPVSTIIAPATASYNTSYAFGAALSGGKAGVPLVFGIQAVDAYGNKRNAGEEGFTVSITPQANITLIDKGTGVYLVKYKADTAGRYSIEVRLDEVR